MQAKQEDN